MKCSYDRLGLKKSSRLANVTGYWIGLALISFCLLDLAQAKTPVQNQISLDDIQLDETPVPFKSAAKIAAKTEPKTIPQTSVKQVAKSASQPVAQTVKATPPKAAATPARKPAAAPVSLDDIQLDDDSTLKPVAAKETAKVAAKLTAAQVDGPSDEIKTLMAAADLKEKAKEFDVVIGLLRPKIDQLPRSGLLQIARAYGQQKDFANQIRAIELITAKNPKDYVALVQLGDAYLEMKRTDDAGTAYGAARELNAKYRPAYDGAWKLLEATQETAEARTLVLDIIKTFGPDSKTTAALCRMFSGEGFIPERSEEVCRTAIKIDPKNPDNYVYLTMSLRETDQKENADKTIIDAAQRFPASDIVQNMAGEMKSNEKSFADSYRYFTRAVKANPKSSRAQVGLAKSSVELQKHGEAIEAFVAACKLDRRTTLDFRQAATTLKRNKDAKWMLYQNALDDRCE